jgi:hypothetical protein
MSEPAAKPNRRLSIRRQPKGRLRAACRKGAMGLGPNLALTVLDLSETGVRLTVAPGLTPGQQVSVTVEGAGTPRPIERMGTVIWLVPAADGTFCAGVRFDKRLPYGDFLHLT